MNEMSELYPGVSIIIPHYNSFSKLIRLLSTVPDSDRLQIIVVDDCSDTVTEQEETILCKTLTERNAIYIKQPVRCGAGSARNKGLSVAAGKWLLFADADDFFAENAFEILFRYVESESDIVFFPPQSIYANNGLPADRHRGYASLCNNFKKNRSRKAENDLRYGYSSPCSKLIRRDMVDSNRILFDETPVANDVMFSMLAGYYAGQIEVSSETIYIITASGDTLTTKKDYSLLQCRAKVFTERYSFLQSHLQERDFDLLSLSGKKLLWQAYSHYGIKAAIEIYSFFRSRNVKVFSFRYLKDDIRRMLPAIKAINRMRDMWGKTD